MATSSPSKPSGNDLDLPAYINPAHGAGGAAPPSAHEGRFDALALKVRSRVELDQVRADLDLVGNKVYSACVGLDARGRVGRTTIPSDTRNSRVWKLENPERVFEHWFVGDTGRGKFWARLCKLVQAGGLPAGPRQGEPDFAQKKEWNHVIVFTWRKR